jgi:hypothetical protein
MRVDLLGCTPSPVSSSAVSDFIAPPEGSASLVMMLVIYVLGPSKNVSSRRTILVNSFVLKLFVLKKRFMLKKTDISRDI